MELGVVNAAVDIDLRCDVAPLGEALANGVERWLLKLGLADEADGKGAAAEVAFFIRGYSRLHFLETQIAALCEEVSASKNCKYDTTGTSS